MSPTPGNAAWEALSGADDSRWEGHASLAVRAAFPGRSHMKEDGVGLEAGAWLGRCPGCGPVFRGSAAKEFAMEQGCASQAMGAVSNNL